MKKKTMTRIKKTITAFTAIIFTSFTILPSIALATTGYSTEGEAVAAGSVYVPAEITAEAFQADLFTGRVSTSIPIVVPPGRNKMQPELSLNYTSLSRWGTAGAGWDLSMSYMEVDTSKKYADYSYDALRLNLNGVSARLLWDENESRYIPEDEGTFFYIPDKNTVIDKDGTKYSFGSAPDYSSQLWILQPGGVAWVFRYYLDKIEDVHGNNIKYIYARDGSYDVPDLTDIYYTGYNDVTGPHHVKLTWEERDDHRRHGRSLGDVDEKRRLKKIETFIGGDPNPVRTYALNYVTGNSETTGRSLLESVVETGYNGEGEPLQYTMGYQTYPLGQVQEVRGTEPLDPNAGDHLWKVKIGTRTMVNGYPTYNWYYEKTAASGAYPEHNPKVSWQTDEYGRISFSCSGPPVIGGGWAVKAETYIYRHETTPFYIYCSGGTLNGTEGHTSTYGIGWKHIVLEDIGSNGPFQPLDAQVTSSLLGSGNLMNSSELTLAPIYSGDFNGDGCTDLLDWDKANQRFTVSLSTGTGFEGSNTWLEDPQTFVDFGNEDDTLLLADFNADGFTDVGTYNFYEYPDRVQVALSSGTSFNEPVHWSWWGGQYKMPVMGDFNGDGIADLGFFQNAGPASLDYEICTTTGGTGTMVRPWGDNDNVYQSAYTMSGDMNGDGLTDLVVKINGESGWRTLINRGKGMVDMGIQHTDPNGNKILSLIDANSDGMSDMCIYRWPAESRWDCSFSNGIGFDDPWSFWIPWQANIGFDGEVYVALSAGDYNGDGVMDVSVYNKITREGKTAIMDGCIPDLMTSFTTPRGAKTTITYGTTSGMDNIDPITELSTLPLVMPVVLSVVTDNGMPEDDASHYKTTLNYSYAKGRYDFNTRQFVGFGEVKVTDAYGITTIKRFHQDIDKKGLEYESEVIGSDAKLYSKTITNYEVDNYDITVPTGNEPGRYVKVKREIQELYDGNEVDDPIVTKVEYEYDTLANYGNLLKKIEWGKVANAGDTSLSGDERVTVYEYCDPNTTTHIVKKLNQKTIYTGIEPSGTPLSRKTAYYDDLAFGEVGTWGHITREERWLDGATNHPAIEYEYDEYYGNMTKITSITNYDQNTGLVTENTYDSVLNAFIVKTKNPAGHEEEFSYDYRWGLVEDYIDFNDEKTTKHYDEFGRLKEIWGPKDQTYPSVWYEYGMNSAPNRVTKSVRIEHDTIDQNKIMVSHTFVDGLGTTIQTRTPAEEDGYQIVSGQLTLGDRGEVVKAGYSSTEAEPSPSTAYIEQTPLHFDSYEYDAIGRRVKTTKPKSETINAEWITEYNRWERTETNGNGHKVKYTNDAYERLVKVTEYDMNNAEYAVTNYTYDLLDNLVRIEDAADTPNTTILEYDTLSRKIRMEDPDMGEMLYTYDVLDNLTHQTDDKGNTLRFSYDSLNRLRTKEIKESGSSVYSWLATYTYDGLAENHEIGNLISMSDQSGATTFEYDELGRVTSENKNITGEGSYTISYTYNALDRLKTVTWENENYTITHEYNRMGTVERITDSQAGVIVSDVDYNESGQRTFLALGNGTETTYTYDEYTRYLAALKTTKGTQTTHQDYTYVFDNVGNILNINDYVNTATQEFEYDALSRLRQAKGINSYGTINYTYDEIGNIVTKGLSGQELIYTYGQTFNGITAGPHAVTSRSDGSEFHYDKNGNMIHRELMTHSGVSEPVRPIQQLTYDTEDQLIEVQESTASVTLALNQGWNFITLPVKLTSYDAVQISNQLGSDFEELCQYNNQDDEWEYFVEDSTFDDFNTLEFGKGYLLYVSDESSLTFTGTMPTAEDSYILEQGLNLIGASSDKLTTEELLNNLGYGGDSDYVEVWKFEDNNYVHLTSDDRTQLGEGLCIDILTTPTATWNIPASGFGKTTFVYDADGNRVKKVVGEGSGAITTLYLGQSYEKKIQGADEVATRYIFLDDVRVASIDSDGQVFYYHGDHLGSSNIITDTNGDLAEHSEYMPFGNMSVDYSRLDDEQEHKFTDQIRDASTGLYYYNARYYDPELARFIQADTIVPTPYSNPQSFNRYSYTINNPVIYMDPSGHGWFMAIVKFILFVLSSISIEGTITTDGDVSFAATVSSSDTEMSMESSEPREERRGSHIEYEEPGGTAYLNDRDWEILRDEDPRSENYQYVYNKIIDHHRDEGEGLVDQKALNRDSERIANIFNEKGIEYERTLVEYIEEEGLYTKEPIGDFEKKGGPKGEFCGRKGDLSTTDVAKYNYVNQHVEPDDKATKWMTLGVFYEEIYE